MSFNDGVTALALVSGLLLAFPIINRLFSEPDLRFRALVRNGLRTSKWSLQRDYRLFWSKLPLWAYYPVFIVWHTLITFGVFLLILFISWIHWKTNGRKPPEMPVIGLNSSVRVAGVAMLLSAGVLFIISLAIAHTKNNVS